MTKRIIYPKDFIKDTLIGAIGEIVHINAYLSFSMICSGIEFLGKCLDTTSRWEDGLSKEQFEKAIFELFPYCYRKIAEDLYRDLRCGFAHRVMPGTSIILMQNKGDSEGKVRYKNHPYIIKDDKKVLVIEYFYFDFVEACKKVLAISGYENKMNNPILIIGDFNKN